MYAMAKSAREKLKAKARSLAAPGTLKKDQDTTQADWTPAEPLDADVKTGARPVGKARLYNKGGKVSGSAVKARADRKARKAGGKVEKEIGIGMSNKDVREANELREGKKHIGGFKKGGKARATGGSVPSDKETGLDKKRVGTIQVKPTRGKAENYKKGGKIKKADGGGLPSPEEAIGTEVRMKGLKVMPGKASTAAAEVTPAQLRREEGYTAADMKAPRAGRKEGGRKWIQKAIEKPGALRKSLGVKEGEKIPAKKLAKAAEASGKLGKRARLAETLGRMNRATGGRTKSGKGKTNINIVIAAGQKRHPAEDMPPAAPRDGAVPIPMPAAPPPAMMGAGMPPMPPGGAGLPMPRKAGGRITKVAKSYKDMEAGAASGEGRLQKTDIESRHTDAPARKAGGRISKVAKSYKDMTAGAGDGEGRLQKTDIAKAKKARGK
jgi:hypothetical protein